MNKRFFSTTFAILIVAVCSMFSTVTSSAVETCSDYYGRNVSAQNYTTFSKIVNSYLTSGDSLMRFQGDATEDKYIAEYYDDNYSLIKNVEIPKELPLFGGFYETDSNYYVFSGQKNPNESDDVEVFRLTKYDKNWNRLGSAELFGANTHIPFDAGSARITSVGKYIIIRTCHEMYKSSDVHHQANATLQCDTDTMEFTETLTGISNESHGYASHSFNQFVKVDGTKLVAVDHGDAYPRSIVLTEYYDDVTNGSFGKDCKISHLMTFSGNIGDNKTGASVGGFEYSDTNYIVAGNTINQDAFSTSTTRNIFVAVKSKANDSFSVKYLTNYAEGEDPAETPHLVKINSNRFLVIWCRNSQINYAEIDGEGNQVGEVHTFSGELSDCVPIVHNNKVVWYTWADRDATFYEIDLNDISKHNAVTINNGHDFEIKYATEDNPTASVKCKKCGYETSFDVPDTFSSYWSADGQLFTSQPHPSYDFKKDIISVIYFNGHNPLANEIVVEVSDESALKVKKLTNTKYRYTPLKRATVNIKIYLKYRPSVCESYDITLKHTFKSTETLSPTCTETGIMTYECENCNYSYTETIPATGHSLSKSSHVDATCTKSGEINYSCGKCGFTTQEEIDAFGHTEVFDKAVAPTCTETGLTRGKHCSECNEILIPQKVVEALGHTEVIDKAVEPTCAKNGLTQGKHCSVCNKVLVPQKVLKALPHTEVIDKGFAATFTKAGLSDGKHCSVCNKILVPQKTIPVLRTKIKFTKLSTPVYIKSTVKIKATVTNPVGKTTYTSSNKKVATVNSKGKITAKKAGKTIITISNNGVSKKFTLKVNKPKLARKSVSIKKGKYIKVKIKGKIKNINNKYYKNKFAKVVSKKSASTLKIKGLKKGKTILKIKVSGIILELNVKVR